MSKSSELDAKELQKYLESQQEMEKKITKRIVNLNNSDLQLIKVDYKKIFGKDLIVDEFKQKLSGDYLNFILALFENPVDYDVKELNKVFTNTTNDNKQLEVLIEIIAPKPKWVIEKIKEAYNKKHVPTFEERLKEFLTNEPHIFNVLSSVSNSERNKNDEPKEDECLEIAKNLERIGETEWKNSENLFYKIICKKSPQEISTIAQKYYELTKDTLLDAVKKGSTNEQFNSLRSILFAIISPSEYFANKIHDAITTEPIDKNTLIRVIVSRYELDIQNIKDYYKQIYKTELIKDANKLDENFKHLLAGLIGDS